MKILFNSYCLLLLSFTLCAQEKKQATALVMFYNVENFFDPANNGHPNPDNDFTPRGAYRWTWNRLRTKRDGIAKTIIAAGVGDAPLLIGLCEVENRVILNQLVQETPLGKWNYGIVHRDSPDPRGIDVALLYRKDYFSILSERFYKVHYEPENTNTREILYAKGVWNGLDTLHVFVNHFPSKFGGAQQSEPRRMRAAETLRAAVDSIFATNSRANIIIMGDFNDTPDSRPVTAGLHSLSFSDSLCNACLYNLMLPLAQRGEGSLKYRGVWELIDLFFVSGNLLNKQEPIYIDPKEVIIFREPFLLEKDERYLGEQPKRTFIGLRYHGGISDHLPVLMKIRAQEFE